MSSAHEAWLELVLEKNEQAHEVLLALQFNNVGFLFLFLFREQGWEAGKLVCYRVVFNWRHHNL